MSALQTLILVWAGEEQVSVVKAAPLVQMRTARLRGEEPNVTQ